MTVDCVSVNCVASTSTRITTTACSSHTLRFTTTTSTTYSRSCHTTLSPDLSMRHSPHLYSFHISNRLFWHWHQISDCQQKLYNIRLLSSGILSQNVSSNNIIADLRAVHMSWLWKSRCLVYPPLSVSVSVRYLYSASSHRLNQRCWRMSD